MLRNLINWRGEFSRTPTRKNAFRARLNLETMEERLVPAALSDNAVAIAAYSASADSTANLYDPATAVPLGPTIAPFAGYRGVLAVAAADVNGDGTSDLIVAAQGAGGHVEVFDGKTGNLLRSFLAFPGFLGGVNVGAADVNGDGYQDVLVTANDNAHVSAFSGKDGSVLASFLAFPGFEGPISASGADFGGGAADEIIVGAGGPGINGRVAIFRPDGSVFDPGFFAFPGFNGAISVAGGDVNGDGVADIVVGAGPGGPGGAVKAFSGSGFITLDSFLAYVPSDTGGVDVRVADANGDGVRDIVVVAHGGGPATLLAFDGKRGTPVLQASGGQPADSGGDSGGSNAGGDSGGYIDTGTDITNTVGDLGTGADAGSGGDNNTSGNVDSGGDDGGDNSGGDSGCGCDTGDGNTENDF